VGFLSQFNSSHNIVKCLEEYVFDAVFAQLIIWKFLDSQFIDALIRINTQAAETDTFGNRRFFAVFSVAA
jgi:hypothetical protein